MLWPLPQGVCLGGCGGDAHDGQIRTNDVQDLQLAAATRIFHVKPVAEGVEEVVIAIIASDGDAKPRSMACRPGGGEVLVREASLARSAILVDRHGPAFALLAEVNCVFEHASTPC